MQVLNRSELRLLFDGRPLIVTGEALLPGHGGPNFVVFSRNPIRWEDGGGFDEDRRDEVFHWILREAPAHGLAIEISGPWGGESEDG